MKATHHDLELILNRDTLDQQSTKMLKALQQVPVKPSKNQRYTQKMEDAHRRINLILEKRKTSIPWNWIFLILTIIGLIFAIM